MSATFGPATIDDPLYEAVSAGRKHQGMEHWLPLFHDHLDTLFDYRRRADVLSHQAEEAKAARLELIADYYATRRQFLERQGEGKENAGAPPYKPLPPERKLYLTDAEWRRRWRIAIVRDLSPFQAPESKSSVDAGGKTAAISRRSARRGASTCSKRRPNMSRRCRREEARRRGGVERRLGGAPRRRAVRSRAPAMRRVEIGPMR
jgi:transcription-repair coupling factor (superfamily II helicase)